MVSRSAGNSLPVFRYKSRNVSKKERRSRIQTLLMRKLKNHAEKMSDLGDHEDGGEKLLRSVGVKNPDHAGSRNAPNIFVTAILICEIQVHILFAVFPVS